jgi:hypothetical protein
MTGNVQVTSGAAPYAISYGLAQDATTMSINIRKSSDKSIVRTLSGADIPSGALTAGTHTAEVTWDGKITGGATAPNGNYYAEVVTTGAPYSSVTAAFGPTIPSFDLNGVTKADGRNYYGLGVITDPDSPWHNVAFMPGRTNGNAPQVKGVYRVGPDGSNLGGFADPVQPASSFDWISGASTSDGKVVLSGQTTGTLKFVNPDGTLYKQLTGNATSGMYTRGIRFSGTADAGNIVFVDVGSTGGGVNTISMASMAGTTTTVPASTVLIDNATLALPTGAAPRTLAVDWDANNNPAAIYVSYWAPVGVAKYVKSGAAWVKDTTFNWVMPDFSAPLSVFVALSPDKKIVWVSMNDNINGSPNSIIQGVDAATGALYKADPNYVGFMTFNPENLAVSSGGNLFVTNYNGFDTGVTGNAVAVVLTPDSGSSDTTRGADFLVTADTQVHITNVQATATYHGATITWTTNYPTDSTVSYGTTAGAEDQTATDAALTTNHSISLDNLASGTKFYFTTKSTASGLTDGVSAEASFTTTTLTLSNVQVTNLTDSSVVITFKTSEPGLGIVRYARTSGGYIPGALIALDARHPGEITASGLPATAAPLSTDHSVTITGLSPGTTYYFVAESGYKTTDTANVIFRTVPTYGVDSAEMTLTTLATIQTTSTSLTATTSSATLNFTTNPASAAVVKWGSAPDALTNTVNVASGTAHSAQLTGLSAGTTYYYTVTLSASGAATRTTVPNTLITALPGGTPSTLTQNTAADLTSSTRSQIALGAAAGLVSLEKQGVPSFPNAGTDLPEGRYYGGMAAYNGFLYYIGGLNPAGSSTTTAYVAPVNADGSFGAWTTTTALPSGRYLINDQVVAYGGYIYIVGGAGGTAAGNVVYFAKQNADGTLQDWQTTTALPVDRDLASAQAVDGVMYLMCGETVTEDEDNRVFQAAIHADGTLGAWSLRSHTKDGLYFQRTATNAHKIYIFGGLTDTVSANYAVGDVNTVDIATTQPFQDITPFLRDTDDLGHSDGTLDALHYSMGAGLLRGKIVTAGGRIATNTYNDTISYGVLNADGSTGPWTASGSVMPQAIKDNTAVAYNGVLYVGGGRTAAGAQPGVTYLPFDADPDNAGYVYAGNLDSKVIDLGALSNLTHLKVTASGGGVEVRYRFAGTDGVFTPYFTSSGLDADISGSARYFQYQLVLTGNGSSTPVVSSVALTTAAALPGTFTRADVQNALKIAAGLSTVSSADKTRLDLDSDGAVTLRDAVAINRKVNNL